MQQTAGSTEPRTLNAVTKAATASVPVYRFYNASTGAHFYTTSATERDSIRARLPSYSYEGTAFEALAQAGTGLAPVYRFYNTQTGVHFYTISESEKNLVRDSLPQFHLEGVAYYASQVAATGFRPLYRSYVLNKGFHFYSVNASETAGLAQYRAEGVGYYVVGTAPEPDPGTADATCQLANFQVDLMQQINAARAVARSCGSTARPAATAVSWDAALAAAAARHSSDMAQNNFFSHTGSDGSTVGLRATAAGYSWSAIGENIAAGHTTVSEVMTGWLSSEGHCNNIMNSAYTHVALACVAKPGTTYTRYWTMVLGRH
ncbi:CAP domain-containing protein [Hydrogenophaga sp. A37]|uniref:CAP domain-containing protein n=1 Tax=Hydrogenophaga sp. A37 TaxID=1945864 RepID=UPI00209B739F|nr:CAP domain-containing protein [Hydrogenophaga sp. A37]